MDEKLTDKQVREKAVGLGIDSLSDAELLSILFREGDSSRSALQVSKDFMDVCSGQLTALESTDIRKLRSMAGIGLTKAVYIKAALELANRCQQNKPLEVTNISHSQHVIDIFKPILGALQHEEFWALYLNSAGRILDKIRISQGGISQTIVDSRIIVKRAVENLATSIIIVHNHPSGDPTPSQQDIDITQKLVQAAELFEINISDHIIITTAKCASLKGLGYL